MKKFIALMLLSSMVHANVDQAIRAADDFDFSYGDTISENGDIEHIMNYKSFTVYMNDKDEVTKVILRNDFSTYDGKKSVMIGTLEGENVQFVDALTGEDW